MGLANAILIIAGSLWLDHQITANDPERLLEALVSEGRIRDSYREREVKNTIRKYAGQIQECYAASIQRGNTKSGAITLDWYVDSDGTATAPEVIATELPDRELVVCIQKKIAGWRFPPPDRRKYVEHTFRFVNPANRIDSGE